MPTVCPKTTRVISSLLLCFALTSAAVIGWGQSTWTIAFADAATSAAIGSAPAGPEIEVRRINGKRLDIGDDGRALGALTGTFNIPGDYADLAAAITDLNASGVSGPVTLNVIAGNPQTSPAGSGTTGGGYIIGGTGSLLLTTTSAVNTVTIQGNGNSVTAASTLVAGQLNDGIFKLIGADWITITGFTMLENPANTTTTAASNNMTEFGVALFYVVGTDGAQNNTIQNNTIDLNRTYQNTFGIYSNNSHTSTSVTVGANSTTTAGANSGTKIYGNQITDVNLGIVVVGSGNSGTEHNAGIDIGGASAPTGNTITNYGTTGTFSGYFNVSGTVYGILVRNSTAVNVSFNSITSSNGGVTSGTLRGIYLPASTQAPTPTFTNSINNNTIALTDGVSGTLQGITVETTTGNATSTLNINNNNFTAFTSSVASSGTFTVISNAVSVLNTSINNNTFTNLSTNTTGSFTFISNSVTRPASAVCNVNNNSIVTGFNKTGAGGTVTFYTSNSTTPATSTETNSGNNFSNITVTGATTIAGWGSTDGSTSSPFGPAKTVTNNTFQNITGGTSAITGLTVGFSTSANVANNLVSNITSAGAITGITTSTGNETFSQNTVHTLSSSGATVVTGMSNTGSTGTTKTFSRNKIYNLENTNSATTVGLVNGILTSSLIPTTNIFNNLIGDLRAPNSGSTDAIRGFSCTATTTAATLNLSFNTIYLNASSVGASFGTSGVFHTTSTTATTATLVMRNNIIVNTSTPNIGGGSVTTAAFRRSSGAAGNLANYGSASNNNLFYAGTPGGNRLIYDDGLAQPQTIAQYKAGVFTAGTIAPRDSNSVSENPPFLSTTGSSPDFLHINPSVATQIESGGIAVTGITDDFDGNTRNATTPDIGADEFTGVPLDIVGPSISYTPFGNTTQTTNRALAVTITDASGVAGGGLAPRIYFRKNGGSYVSTQCTGSSPSYTCTIDYSLVGGVVATDVINYFVIAQDTAGNVSINPGGGASATDVNNVTMPPTTPNAYTIVAPFASSVNVGTGETYTSLTNAGGLFEAMNAATFTGNTTINITSDLTGELGTVALNQINEDGPNAGTLTVLIRPSGGARSITGSNTGSLIRLNGADRVTIDGSTTGGTAAQIVGGDATLRELTIQNTNTGTSAAVISVGSNATNGAQNNAVRNVNILGQDPTTTLVGISFGGATAGTVATGPNNGNRLENCSVKRAIFGIYSAGVSTASQNTGTVITKNETSAVTADRVRRVGILVFNDNGVQLTLNSLNGINTNESADGIGIGLGAQSIDTTLTTTGGITNALVDRNKINGVASLSTTGFSAAGITVAGTTGAANTIRNNMITGVTAPATSPDLVAGIYIVGATGSVTRVYHNSVAMTGDRGAVASQMPSFAMAVTGTDPAVELKDNIFYTTQTASGGGVNAKSYTIGMVTTTFTNLDSNYNDFFASGANAGFFRSGSLGSAAGTDYATLAAWQTAVSDDANSQEVDPVFIDPVSDLHLNGAMTPLLGDGITGFATVDFDGQTRENPPDIGADEILASTNPSGVGNANPSTVVPGGMTLLTVTVTPGTNPPSTGLTVTGDLSSIGGLASQQFFDDGTNGDVTSGDNIFSFQATVSIATTPGLKMLPTTITDAQARMGSATINLTVTAPANPGSLQFSSATYLVTENVGMATITVTRTGGSDGAVSVSYATVAGGSATGGMCGGTTDYVTTSGSVFWANGDSASKTFDVVICDDSTDESDETVNLAITTPTGGASLGTPNTAVLTIQDNDPAPTISIGDVVMNEGNSGTTSFQFTVSLSNPSSQAVSATVNTADGTATAPGDYTAISGSSVSIPAGQTSGTVTVSVNGDTSVESNETFFVNLTAPANGTIGDGQGLGTITNDDTDVSVAVAPSSVAEDGPTNLVYTFTRTGVTSGPLVVNFSVGGTATFNTDYTQTGATTFAPPNGTVTFGAGNSTATVTVDPTADSTVEPDETVVLTVTSGTGYNVGAPSAATGTITNDDTDVTVAVAPSSAAEDGATNLVYTFTRTGVTSGALTVNFSIGGTATFNTDYTQTGAATFAPPIGTVTFTAGSSTATVTVDPTADTTVESDETVILTVTAGTGYNVGVPSTATGTITNDDTSVSIAVAPSSVAEDGATNLVYTFTRAGVTTGAITVNFSVGGTATFSTDYTQTGAATFGVSSGTVVIGAGNTTATVTVDPTADTTVELDETVILTVTSGTGYNVGAPSAATGTITNDDTDVSVAVAPSSVAEDGPTNLVYTFTRTGVTSGPLVVNFSVGGTATFNTDYTQTGATTFAPPNGTVTFAAGSSTATVTVDPTADSTVEPDETVVLTVTSGTGYNVGAPSAATGTITNDDATLQFSSATYSVGEARPEAGPTGVVPAATITVTRTGATGNTLTVDYALLGGGTATGGASCTPGVDFINFGGTLTFNPGVTSQTFSVQTCFDTTAEGNETVNMGLSNVTGGGTLGTPSTAVLTITDNDVPTITLSSSTYIEDESQTMVVTVNRSGSGVASSVQLTTGGGTATGGTCAGGADYVSQNTTVNFNTIETSKTVNIAICSDMFLELNETFTITLSSPSGATLGSPSTATATINETASQFTNMSPITITDGAMGSSTINVTGGVTSIFYMRVTLFDIQQSVAADDLNLLLVGPNGVTSFVLMSDAGGAGNPIPSGTTLTFNDNSATFLPDENPFIVSGSYKPTSYRAGLTFFPPPAPPVTAEPGPGGARSAIMNAVYGGTNSNGTWTLYVKDDNGGVQPLAGTVAGGWGLEFLAPTAAPASLAGRVTTADGRGINGALLTIQGGALPEPRIARTGLFGFYSIDNLPAGHTYIVTVGSKRYVFAQPSQTVALVDSLTDVNFTAMPSP